MYRIPFIKYQFPQIFNKNKNPQKFVYKELKNFKLQHKLSNTKGLIQNESKFVSKGIIPTYYANLHTTNIYTSNGDIVANLAQKPLKTFTSHIKTLPTLLNNSLKTLQSYK